MFKSKNHLVEQQEEQHKEDRMPTEEFYNKYSTPSKFNRNNYKNDGEFVLSNAKGTAQKLPTFPDGSDTYANLYDTVISFQNIRNNKDVFFKAFITAFNENYTPNFNATEVFGRTDPIMQYKNTTRNITLAWKLPASSEGEAYENLGRVQNLLQMLYPSYLEQNSALTLSEAPLVRLKVMNLLQKIPDSREIGTLFNGEVYYDAYQTTNDSSKGILGVITSCNVNHNLESVDGVFEKIDSEGRLQQNTILPKLIDINISFIPLHEKTLDGFDNLKDDGKTTTQHMFPYGVTTILDAKPGDQRLIQQGKSLNELIKLKQTIEEKRRGAAQAQQVADKMQAAYKKAARRAKMIYREETPGDITTIRRDPNSAAAIERDRLADSISRIESVSEGLYSEADALEDFL
jgi:hypothetical protein